MVSFNLTIGAVEPHHLSQCLNPADDLDDVFFHPELSVHVDKQSSCPSKATSSRENWRSRGKRDCGHFGQGWRLRGPQPSAPLTFLEIFSKFTHQNKTAWNIPPPKAHWCQCSRPGGRLLARGFNRQEQTFLARFRSGPLKTINFPKDPRALKCVRTVLLSRPHMLTSSNA
ncbi:uncharacterized protein TNCV_155501 [Trichonephila clavipes]|uniref:Uncharacterized protein n=1 Tax=Trichonephila clavipes TaxID=2585209 RepID=A0A8X6WH50_TRICX|nr:uncharacterized protein TNCV_155501 [Trichonephila clavipes]